MERNTHVRVAYDLLSRGVHLAEIARFFDAATPEPPPLEDREVVEKAPTSPCEAYPDSSAGVL